MSWLVHGAAEINPSFFNQPGLTAWTNHFCPLNCNLSALRTALLASTKSIVHRSQATIKNLPGNNGIQPNLQFQFINRLESVFVTNLFMEPHFHVSAVKVRFAIEKMNLQQKVRGTAKSGPYPNIGDASPFAVHPTKHCNGKNAQDRRIFTK